MLPFRSTLTVLAAAGALTGCGSVDPLPGPFLDMTITPADVTIEAGATGQAAVRVFRMNTEATVTLTASGGGTGVTPNLSNVAHGTEQTTATLTVTVAEDAVAGPYNITVKAANADADDATKAVFVLVVEGDG